MTRSILAMFVMVGCTTSEKPVTMLPDSTLTFPLDHVDATRFAATCGVANPPFLPQDLYDVDLIAVDPSVPRSTIDVAFHPTVPLHQPLPVTLGAVQILSEQLQPDGTFTHIGRGQMGPFATAADDAHFTWGQGENPDLVDPNPLATTTVQIDAIDGNALGIDLQMTFVDGGVLHFRIDATAFSGESGCPAG